MVVHTIHEQIKLILHHLSLKYMQKDQQLMKEAAKQHYLLLEKARAAAHGHGGAAERGHTTWHAIRLDWQPCPRLLLQSQWKRNKNGQGREARLDLPAGDKRDTISAF